MNDLSPSTMAAGCRITARGFVEARFSEIGALRNRPAPEGGPALPPRFLRHADEHTVVGVHAVLDAIVASDSSSLSSLEHHAVVAAPCQSGRLITARALAALPTGGASVVGPHIVPQCSLHSVAGAVSVALAMHGPHLGVGGGSESLGEGLLAAMTLLMNGSDPACRAVWLVATEWDKEPLLDSTGSVIGDPVCRAIATLLEPVAPDGDGDGERHPSITLALRTPGRKEPAARRYLPSSSLVAFATALGACGDSPSVSTTTLVCPGGIEIDVTSRQHAAAMREAA